MFSFGKKPIELDTATRSWQQTLEAWATKRGFTVTVPDGRHVRLNGSTDGAVWQLNAGRPNRPYLKGVEIKVGVRAAPEFHCHGVVCTRAIAERIREVVYGDVTEEMNTHANKEWPEEMMWVTTLREFPLPAPAGEYITCYGSPAAVLGAYAGQFIAALPGGVEAAGLNAIVPWLAAFGGGSISLRTAAPVLDLEGVETALSITRALLKPVRLLTLKP